MLLCAYVWALLTKSISSLVQFFNRSIDHHIRKTIKLCYRVTLVYHRRNNVTSHFDNFVCYFRQETYILLSTYCISKYMPLFKTYRIKVILPLYHISLPSSPIFLLLYFFLSDMVLVSTEYRFYVSECSTIMYRISKYLCIL